MSLRGYDISSWQAGINVKNVPSDFVIVKATGGVGYINPFFNNMADSTLACGKKLGIYHFARERGCAGDAKAEADYFLKAFNKYKGKAIPILDWEADAVNLDVSWAKTWLDRVASVTGATPWFYSYSNAINSHNYSSISKYPLWIAAYYRGYDIMGYQANPPLYGGTGAWGKATAYQYTSSGRISNWGGNLDLNIFYGTKSDWDKYCGNSSKKEEKVETPGKIEKFVQTAINIANDNSHGYSQVDRWVKDYDCSSMMYICGVSAGYNLPTAGTRYTGTMRRDFVGAGFKAIPFSQVGLSGLKRGDVLLNETHHTEMYIGNGKFVGAHSNWDGRSGDSSGQEISIGPAYVYGSGWDYVLRPPAESPAIKEDDDLKEVNNKGGKVYRLCNAKSGKHILTLSTTEKSALVKKGWKDEGVAFTAPKGGIIPIYRFYNTNGDHLYTTNYKEAQTIQKSGWEYEGVPFFGKEKGSPMYRIYTSNHHLFTADKNERDTLIKKGWKDEGVAWYF